MSEPLAPPKVGAGWLVVGPVGPKTSPASRAPDITGFCGEAVAPVPTKGRLLGVSSEGLH